MLRAVQRVAQTNQIIRIDPVRYETTESSAMCRVRPWFASRPGSIMIGESVTLNQTFGVPAADMDEAILHELNVTERLFYDDSGKGTVERTLRYRDDMLVAAYLEEGEKDCWLRGRL